MAPSFGAALDVFELATGERGTDMFCVARGDRLRGQISATTSSRASDNESTTAILASFDLAKQQRTPRNAWPARCESAKQQFNPRFAVASVR